MDGTVFYFNSDAIMRAKDVRSMAKTGQNQKSTHISNLTLQFSRVRHCEQFW